MTGKGYIAAKGIRHVILHLAIGKVVITHVMWVPELKGFASLLSVPQLTENGFKVSFDNKSCEVSQDNKLFAIGSKINRAYYLDVHSNSTVHHVSEGTIPSDLPILGHHNMSIAVDPDLYSGQRKLQLTTYDWFNSELDTFRLNFSQHAMVHGTSDT